MEGDKAFYVASKLWPASGGITAAPTAGRARYMSYLTCDDMGRPERVCDFAVLRLPELDEWAQASSERNSGSCWSPEHVPGGSAAVARLLERRRPVEAS